MADDDWRPKLTHIHDPIAEDFWEYRTPQGQRRTSRLVVGRPTHHPEARAWYCPILIEGHSPGPDAVFGQGPVDALMNAMGVVRTFFEQNLAVVPGVRPRATRRKSHPAGDRPQKKVARTATPAKKPRQKRRSKSQGQ